MTNPYLDDHQHQTQNSVQSNSAETVKRIPTVPHQPHTHPMQIQKPPRNYSKSQRRHIGRLRGCLLTMFASMMLLGLMCMGSLALYLIIPPEPVDILLMGLDSRGDEGVVTRTDSIIVVGVNPSKLNISLLSIPRDLFINVPDYGLQRINTVNVLGELEEPGRGSKLLGQSIHNNFGIGVDKYVRLDFQAFVAVVDAVGGLTIDVPYAITDYDYPTPDYGTMTIQFDAGRQHMDGERALIYARTRHADDDYRRAERQQLVLQALTQKLVNPVNWASVLGTLNQYTETNLNVVDMLKLSPVVILGGGELEQLVINRDYILAGDGYSYPNYNLLQPWIDEHFD